MVLFINVLPSISKTRLTKTMTPPSDTTAIPRIEDTSVRARLKYIAKPKDDNRELLRGEISEKWMCLLAAKMAIIEEVAIRPAA